MSPIGSRKFFSISQSDSNSNPASSALRFDILIAPLDPAGNIGTWELRRSANYWNTFSSSMLQLAQVMTANQMRPDEIKTLVSG